ncbi:NSFL1 cofactor p47-like isoform X2 [Halichondria panicea]|uniref:NSFL1 cofactor p47-like isoform X2 n=1 Tax=Halichondria panicea TaxID=6063 RepID=UPI00312B440F
MASIDPTQEESIVQFVSVTGADNERALFYLQAAAWNLESALSAFFDNSEPSHSGDGLGDEPLMPVQETQAPDPSAVPNRHAVPEKEEASSKQQGGIATLSDYQSKPGTSSGDKGQEYFAGGSEHSGQMIEGPPRKKQTPDSIAKEVFESAKNQGAMNIDEEEQQKKKDKSAAFQGSGFKLGDSEGPSVQIRGRARDQSSEKVRHTLTFWKDGFSVDDSELRNGESEADKAFIAAIRKGEIPQELLRSAKGGEVDIDLQDRRTENYVQPKRKVVAFSGEGYKLGGVAPEVVSHASPSSSATPTPPPSVPIDPDQPTTNVQIRLADGSRVVAKFNHTHTVNDIRQYINLCRPSSSVYALMTTFPNRELNDPTQTIAEAKLLNAVVVQRLK